MKQVHIYQKIKQQNHIGLQKKKEVFIYNQFFEFYSREQLNKQINDAEARIKSNREKQKVTKDVHVDGTKQLKYWRDLLRMMELKRKLAMVLIRFFLKFSNKFFFFLLF